MDLATNKSFLSPMYFSNLRVNHHRIMSVAVLLLLFCLGGAVGVLAGLMGIGGGMIMVPFLIAAFTFEGYPAESLIKMALGTSLATIIFTSVASVWAHHNQGSVPWPIVKVMAPGIVLGALGGSQLVGLAPATLIALVFSGFLFWSAWSVALRAPRTSQIGSNQRIKRSVLASGGLVIGAVSSVVGAGGGFMTIPFLIRRGLLPTRAVGCSAACGLPIAIAGTIGYIIAGANANLPGPVIGFIHVPALLAIAAASVLTAPYGARLAHRLAPGKLKKVFGVILVTLATYMLIRTVLA